MSGFRWVLAILAAVTAFAPGTAFGQVIVHVRADAPTGGDGLSWGTAFKDLQIALAQARALATTSPVKVWVAGGTYLPAPITASFIEQEAATFTLAGDVELYGGFAGFETSTLQRRPHEHPSVLSGTFRTDIRARNVLTVSIAGSTVVDNCIISTEGFSLDEFGLGELVRISSGSATFRGCTFVAQPGISAAGTPGGVTVRDSLARFESCRFLGLTSAGTGAVFVEDTPGGAETYAEFVDCLFSGNQATFAAGTDCTTTFKGGAVVVRNVPAGVTFSGCSFFGNTYIGSCGAAVRSQASPLRFRNCLFDPAGTTSNVLISTSSPVELNACIFNGVVTSPALTTIDTLAGSPLIADFDGPDNILGTRDDDPVPGPGSPAIDTGNIILASPPSVTDAAGRRRLFDGDGNGSSLIDRGALEARSPIYSPVLYVRRAATGSNNGASWSDAFSGPTGVARAIDLANTSPGQFTEIWVAAGHYTPAEPGQIAADGFVLTSGLRLLGGFNGSESAAGQADPAANVTVLSADINGDDAGGLNLRDNSASVINVKAVGDPTYIDGFTITGGNAPDEGGGIAQLPGRPLQVRRCIITGNRAAIRGGGAALYEGAEVVDCVFSNNQAPYGAAIGRPANVSDARAPVVRSTRFEHNTAELSGGAVIFGTYTDCDFVRNSAGTSGGAAGVGEGGIGSVRVVNSRFFGNTAGAGGAVSSFGSFDNCLFVGNRATTGNGGAMERPNGRVSNSTLVSNVAPAGSGGGLALLSTSVNTHLENSIFWTNSAANGSTETQQVFKEGTGSVLPFGSIIQGWTGTLFGAVPSALVNGLDPRFLRPPSPGGDGLWGTTDDDYGDCRLAPGSPGIDSGFNVLVAADLRDLDADNNTQEPLPLDLARLPRFVDDPATPDGGGGTAPIVDRGAFEFQPGCPECLGVRQWINPAGGPFDSPYNWSPSVPTALHDTLYTLPAAYTVTFTAPTTGTLTNNSAAIRAGSVTWSLAGQTYRLTRAEETALRIGDSSGAAPSLTISGGVVRAPSVQVASAVGSAGTLNVIGPGTRLVAADESLSVGFLGTGSMNITGGAQVTSRFGYVGDQPGAFGSVLIDGPGSRWNVPFSLTVNNGTLTVRNGGTLSTSFGLFLGQDARLNGNGTVTGPVINFGVLEPGNSPGTLTINGSFTQVGEILDLGPASGLLRMQVESVTPGQFDRLIVTGQTQLGGGLIVESPLGGFPAPPPEGLSLPLIDALGGIGISDTTGMPADHFDVAFFPRVPGPGGGPSDQFLRLERPEGGGAQFFNLTTGTLGAPLNVNDPANTSATSTPSSVTAGDLDGDGLSDLVLTTPSNDSAVILMNRGSMGGEWQGFEGAVQFAVGTNPQGATIFDIDADGIPDLSIVNQGSNSVTLFRNTTIPGSHAVSLSGQGSLTTGLGPTGIIAGGFDGSGTRPVIVTTDEAAGVISILIRTGSPGFNFTPRTSKPIP
ncbi:MAG: FG-GAP-like repeat-containing protein, partial [Phycisphaerales bacterium]